MTNEYDGSDELGFAWDDPAVAVDWPSLAGTPDGRPNALRVPRSLPSWPLPAGEPHLEGEQVEPVTEREPGVGLADSAHDV